MGIDREEIQEDMKRRLTFEQQYGLSEEPEKEHGGDAKSEDMMAETANDDDASRERRERNANLYQTHDDNAWAKRRDVLGGRGKDEEKDEKKDEKKEPPTDREVTRAVRKRFKELRQAGMSTQEAMAKARAELGLEASDGANGTAEAAEGPEDSNDGSSDGMEGGDDLFPTLDNSQKMDDVPIICNAIVPFDEKKSKLEGLFGNRPTAAAPSPVEETKDDPAANTAVVKAKRKRATGLGNLGNTCFMNSTLQCLAHTPPIREYFLGLDHNGGNYKRDVNADNPLGTGGELARAFASLLGEMWTGNDMEDTNPFSSSAVTYPRSFKEILGKHAPQFVGYNQHDSQELAVYLLDILHEDTNRVRKKPYVEKPEQGEDEEDNDAAAKAWGAHLQREDSQIVESFTGQVKSRVQCPVEGCGRVSTTYDPCMYLSVPLPGDTDRTMKVTFVPLDFSTWAEMTVKLDKNATIATLRHRVVEMARECYDLDEAELKEEDVLLADIFRHKVWAYYDNDQGVDVIKDTDETYAYQLLPLERARKEFSAYREKQLRQQQEDEEEKKDDGNDAAPASPSRALIAPATLQELDKGPKQWEEKLAGFLAQPHTLFRLTTPNRSTHEERVKFYGELLSFIQKCKRCSDADGGEPSKRDDDSSLTLDETCQTSSRFRNVQTASDLALLDHCAAKFRVLVSDFNGSPRKNANDSSKLEEEDGLVVEIILKKSDNSSPYGYQHFQEVSKAPIIARVSSALTVGGLRETVGQRLSCALKTSDARHDQSDDMDATSAFQSAPGLMSQVALSYDNEKSKSYGGGRSGSLGSVKENDMTSKQFSFAKASDEEEKELVSSYLQDHGRIFVQWPPHLNDNLEEDMLCAQDEFLTEAQKKEREASNNGDDSDKVTVMDCIAKYCETEQLDETDMWYCNNCKEHVRAWKQFHLHKTPSILIIHLKRFHFSSTTHRRDKIDTLIDFPLENLDLRELVTEWEEGKEPLYDCYAVSNHFGGLGGGHYTAYARGEDGEWCNFDDSRVTTGVDESDVVSSAAYCLYYKRKDVTSDDSDVVMTMEGSVDGCGLDFEAVVPVSPSPCTADGGREENVVMNVDAVQGQENGSIGSVSSYQTPDAFLKDGMDDGDSTTAVVADEDEAGQEFLDVPDGPPVQ
ncbi:hypothetical protein ACHAXT_004236 [Thalassiosira profunda]